MCSRLMVAVQIRRASFWTSWSRESRVLTRHTSLLKAKCTVTKQPVLFSGEERPPLQLFVLQTAAVTLPPVWTGQNHFL